jgi:hypothetical protein
MLDGFLGALAGLFTSWLFYRFGKRDAEHIYRDSISTSVVMRLKEMTPTSKARVPYGHGLDDTAHWITCLSEVVQDTGWREGAEGLKKVAIDLRDGPDHPHPSQEQKEEGERKKTEWIQQVYSVHKPKSKKV